MKVTTRPVDQSAKDTLVTAGVSPLFAKLFAARGIKEMHELDVSLHQLIPPDQLTNSRKMAVRLADAIAANKKLLIVGDYDADGATATAVGIKGLRSMGANVDFLVPNRFEYGYGLTPEIVALAAEAKPDIIITVDNGIASVDGVAAANHLGIEVLITDHHLPAEETPAAACIVNPNQHGCDFASKHLAGVGVMFYVLLALRAEMRERGIYGEENAQNKAPNLSVLLDLVALGTVADLVKLDRNNRVLVEQGLRRIRAGACCEGVKALLSVAGRDIAKVNAQDLGFYVGPRLNAAGRLDDMQLGIACLLAESEQEAKEIAQTLHDLNAERRNIEADMQDDALAILDDIQLNDQMTISLYEASWHQGVVGILASRVKERFHRPVIAFANAGEAAADAVLKGSGRSIPGLHLRDALDLVTKQHPELILKFGGHAMAAGLTIKQADFSAFQQAFETVVNTLLSPEDLQAQVVTDGELALAEMTLETAQLLAMQVWGQGFAAPLFSDAFTVVNQRVVGEKHLKLYLEKEGQHFDAIFFGQSEFLPEQINAVYQLQVNSYQGAQSVQLQVVSV